MAGTEKTRNYIIQKTAPIFNMHGYAGTSMSKLTTAIKMTKGAIYGNFKNKDEIALAAFDYNFRKISKQISKVIKRHDHACDRLIAFANYYLDHFNELVQAGGCPLLNAAVDSDHVHENLKDRVAKALDFWIENVTQIIYRGIRHKQIRETAKPEHFASIFVSLIEGGILLSKTTGNTIHLSRNVDQLIYMINAELRI